MFGMKEGTQRSKTYTIVMGIGAAPAGPAMAVPLFTMRHAIMLCTHINAIIKHAHAYSSRALWLVCHSVF